MYYSTALIIHLKWDQQVVGTTKTLHSMNMSGWAKQIANLISVQYKYEIRLNGIDE
jgi:hypothetical protein